jgi:hypothetical protein
MLYRLVPFFFAMVMTTIPLIFSVNSTLAGRQDRVDSNEIISYLQKNGFQKNVYFFSAKTAYMISVLEHAGSLHTTRLQFFNWLNCYYNCSPNKLKKENPFYAAYAKTNDFLTEMLAEDISRYQPALVFVDELEYPSLQGNQKIDYLSLFNQNSHFKSAWQPYHYLTTIKSQGDNFFQFNVYERRYE